MTAMTDRELQDEIIRYITDPHARRTSVRLKLSAPQAARAAMFARFLARRYYRDRLGRSFRYSATLVAGTRASEVVEADDFGALLSASALGSLALAQRVGERAVDWLKAANPASGYEWWNSLLEYERAHFLQTATSEIPVPGPGPQRGMSATSVTFDLDMPELLRRIKTKQPVGDELRKPTTLLFSRTRGGKIYVMEVDAAAASIFVAVDGKRDETAIARAAGIEPGAARSIINSLVEIGALVSPQEESDAADFQPERVLGI